MWAVRSKISRDRGVGEARMAVMVGGHFGRSRQWLVTNQFRSISTFNPQGGCASANQFTVSLEAVLS